MSMQVIVPRLGLTVTEVTIVEWLVADGAHATEGEPLVTVATDKVEQEILAPATGILRQGAAHEDVVAVGKAMALIEAID